MARTPKMGFWKMISDGDWQYLAMLRVDVEFGYRKKRTSIAIRSLGGHVFEGQNLNIGFGWPDIIFKMGMSRESGHTLNIIEPSWTT